MEGGGTSDQSNYLGIAISSYFSKLFCRILFKRSDSNIEDKNCRTSDHILTLKTLIGKAFKSSRYIYACYVDLSKAFDTID